MSLTDTRSTAIFWGGKFFEKKRVKNRFLDSIKLCYNWNIEKFRHKKTHVIPKFGDQERELDCYLIYIHYNTIDFESKYIKKVVQAPVSFHERGFF